MFATALKNELSELREQPTQEVLITAEAITPGAAATSATPTWAGHGHQIWNTSTFGVCFALVSSPPVCIEVNDNY